MMTEYPIELEWEISEDRLRALKDSTNNEYLKSDTFTVVHATNFEYWISIYPNGNRDERRGSTGIFLKVKLGDEKKVEAECTFSIISANWNHKINHTFDKSGGRGPYFCTVDEFFDSNQKFIVDGKLKVKVKAIFKIENIESNTQSDQSKGETTATFRALWKIGYEDFTIVADGKEIEVHKNVLASYSTVFDAMFSNSKFKEGIENRMEITDFPFEVVENGIQLCYEQKNVSDFSTDENAWLLKFTDKYDIAMIKKNIEAFLSEQITVSNLHEMVKIAEEGNSSNLRKSCLDFFIMFSLKKEFVPHMELLDSEFFAIAIATISRRKTQTL